MTPTLTSTETHADLCKAGRTPIFVNVPAMLYATVDGAGEPGSDHFQQAVRALYSFSYTLKFVLKTQGVTWKVQPLEGLWWTERGTPFPPTDAAAWKWKLMIAQPPQLDASTFDDIIEQATTKHDPSPLLADMHLEVIEEGRAVQVMHVGPYSTEHETIERLLDFIEASGLRPVGRHHEIYLGDPRRTAPERLRTVLRQPVAEA